VAPVHPARASRFCGLLAALVLAAFAGRAAAEGCPPCAFGGLCGGPADEPVECGPTEAKCVPRSGILLFNSVLPNIPAYWTLFARRGTPPGRLVGRLKVFADRELGPPAVPGFPGRCRGRLCFGRPARFDGTVAGDRLTATARYAGGATCEFAGRIAFGLGGAEPNTFVCRRASGEILSQGPFDLQGIRLFGCRP
jgi:hypothetical protein